MLNSQWEDTVSQMQAHTALHTRTAAGKTAAGNCPVGHRQSILSELLSSALRPLWENLAGRRTGFKGHLRTLQGRHLNRISRVAQWQCSGSRFQDSWGTHGHRCSSHFRDRV